MVVIIFACVILTATTIIPNTMACYKQNSRTYFAPTSAWVNACMWLRNNTPEPFEPGYYYKLYGNAERQAVTGNDISRIEGIHKLSDSAYRVLSWWDYGHWIVRIAQRPVVSSPAGGFTVRTASVLVNQDPEDATRICKELYVKYIVIDYLMVTAKFYAIPTWAGTTCDYNTPCYHNSFMIRLWDDKPVDHWQKVWQSRETYGQHAQIKIYAMQELK